MAEGNRARTRFFQALMGAVLAGLAIMPQVLVPTGEDPYRFPKELWVRAEGILLAVVIILGFLWGWLDTRVFARERNVFVLVAAIVAWTGVATIFSSHPAMSVWSLFYVTSSAIIFVATVIAAFRRSLLFADIALLAAVPNAIVCILGEFRIWNPLLTEKEMLETGEWMHLFAGGFLGNPNDVAMLLAGPALASLILCAIVKRRRLWYGSLAIVMLAGLLAAQSSAAIGALVIALLVIAFRARRKAAVAMVSGIVVIVAIISVFLPAMKRKIGGAVTLLRSKQVTAYEIDDALSNRVLPFLVASRMGLDHPVFGVGPGRFGWHFYTYKLMYEERYRTLRKTATNYASWAEAHNDHMQTLATAGFPGYALYVTAIVMLARRSRRTREGDEFLQFTRQFAMPFAAMFAVITLAQFPMELAAPTMMLLHWAALCVAWSSDAAA